MGMGEHSNDEWVRKRPSMAVVEAVSNAEGVPIEEFCPPKYPPLHETIDPQALDSLLEPADRRSETTNIVISFTYCGYAITVHDDGTVDLE